jgi:hypothetical protein
MKDAGILLMAVSAIVLILRLAYLQWSASAGKQLD